MSEKPAIEFPCEFPVKAMGEDTTVFKQTILDIFRRHIPDFKDDAIKSTPSANGKYVSITVTFTATSQEQLDALYQALSDNPLVLMAL